MAKGFRNAPTASQETHEEMTVFMVRLKGGSGTLLKGLDAIKEAIASMGQSSIPNGKRLGASKQSGLEAEDEEELGEDDSISDPPVIDASTSTTPAWKPRKYKFMDDFDLTVSDKPWKEFAAEKMPKSDNECYLVAAQWLTENAETPIFSAAHVFTLFRAMKWNEQKDFTQPLRKLKSASSYFDNPTPKMWKLTGIGLDAARAISGQAAQ